MGVGADIRLSWQALRRTLLQPPSALELRCDHCLRRAEGFERGWECRRRPWGLAVYCPACALKKSVRAEEDEWQRTRLEIGLDG